MKIGDIVYLCIVVPNCGIYDILQLTLRTVEETWAVGVDEHTKQAYLFGFNMVGSYVFTEHYEAQEALLQFRSREEDTDGNRLEATV